MSSRKSSSVSSTSIGGATPSVLNLNTVLAVIAILMILLLAVIYFSHRKRTNDGGLAMEIVDGTTADQGSADMVFDGNEYYIVPNTVTSFTLSPAANKYVGKFFYINNYYNSHAFTFKVPTGFSIRTVDYSTSAGTPVLKSSVTLQGIPASSSVVSTQPRVGQFIFVNDTTLDFIPVA